MAEVMLDFKYDHSIEEVLEAMTNSSILEEWIMPNNFNAEEGHAFEFQGAVSSWSAFAYRLKKVLATK